MDKCDRCEGYVTPLMDSDTNEELGPATDEQVEASLAAGEEGHITIDGDGEVVPESEREHYARHLGETLRRVYVFRGMEPCACAVEMPREVSRLLCECWDLFFENGDLGVIIRTEVAERVGVTASDIREIVREAENEAHS